MICGKSLFSRSVTERETEDGVLIAVCAADYVDKLVRTSFSDDCLSTIAVANEQLSRRTFHRLMAVRATTQTGVFSRTGFNALSDSQLPLIAK